MTEGTDPRESWSTGSPATRLDYLRISEVISAMDAMSIIGQGFPEQVKGLVDPDALLAAALNRADQVVAQLKLPEGPVHRVLTAHFMNAFVAGLRFQREGGHRDGAVGD